MIAAAITQTATPFQQLGEAMVPDAGSIASITGFGALFAELNFAPETADASDSVSEIDADSGPVPDGLEKIADALAGALAAVSMAIGKTLAPGQQTASTASPAPAATQSPRTATILALPGITPAVAIPSDAIEPLASTALSSVTLPRVTNQPVAVAVPSLSLASHPVAPVIAALKAEQPIPLTARSGAQPASIAPEPTPLITISPATAPSTLAVPHPIAPALTLPAGSAPLALPSLPTAKAPVAPEIATREAGQSPAQPDSPIPVMPARIAPMITQRPGNGSVTIPTDPVAPRPTASITLAPEVEHRIPAAATGIGPQPLSPAGNEAVAIPSLVATSAPVAPIAIVQEAEQPIPVAAAKSGAQPLQPIAPDRLGPAKSLPAVSEPAGMSSLRANPVAPVAPVATVQEAEQPIPAVAAKSVAPPLSPVPVMPSKVAPVSIAAVADQPVSVSPLAMSPVIATAAMPGGVLSRAARPDPDADPVSIAPSPGDTAGNMTDLPAPLPLPAHRIVTLGDSAVPTAPTLSAIPIEANTTQPQSASEIVMNHHLDLAKDGEWLDRLARDIAQTAHRDAQLRFQLNPEHLGSLRVELANGADGTTIRLTADTDAARAILADAQPRLLAEARAQGLRISEAQVDLGSQQNGHQRGREENSQTFVRTGRPAEELPDATTRSADERYA